MDFKIMFIAVHAMNKIQLFKRINPHPMNYPSFAIFSQLLLLF